MHYFYLLSNNVLSLVCSAHNLSQWDLFQKALKLFEFDMERQRLPVQVKCLEFYPDYNVIF